MKINEKIQRQRKKLGLSLEEIAHHVNISVNALYDIESYPDEFITTITLNDAKKICDFLRLDILDLLEMKYPSCSDKNVELLWKNKLKRNELIKTKRISLGISKEKLGDKLGFYTESIDRLESDDNYLDSWPIDNIVALAKEIKVPPPILFGIKCVAR